MKARNLFLSLVAAALCALQMNAETQPVNLIPEKGYFVIQGKATQVPEDIKSFRLAVTDLFMGESFDIPFRQDGTRTNSPRFYLDAGAPHNMCGAPASFSFTCRGKNKGYVSAYDEGWQVQT